MKQSRYGLSAVLLVCVLPWAMPAVLVAAPGSTPTFEVVSTDHFEGAIVPAGLVPRGMVGLQRGGVDSYWTPSGPDVERLEASLPHYLRQATRDASLLAPTANSHVHLGMRPTSAMIRELVRQLGQFRRQYVGVAVDGHRRVIASGFPKAGHPDWRERFVFVFDGGCAYWRAEFDVKSGRFVNFGCNGEA